MYVNNLLTHFLYLDEREKESERKVFAWYAWFLKKRAQTQKKVSKTFSSTWYDTCGVFIYKNA